MVILINCNHQSAYFKNYKLKFCVCILKHNCITDQNESKYFEFKTWQCLVVLTSDLNDFSLQRFTGLLK